MNLPTLRRIARTASCSRRVFPSWATSSSSPDGAFYLWVRALEPDDEAFCEKAKAHELLLVPATCFKSHAGCASATACPPMSSSAPCPLSKALMGGIISSIRQGFRSRAGRGSACSQLRAALFVAWSLASALFRCRLQIASSSGLIVSGSGRLRGTQSLDWASQTHPGLCPSEFEALGCVLFHVIEDFLA